MSTNELSSQIKVLRELRRMSDELNAEIETIQDTIKNEMAAREVDELAGTDWKVTWRLVNSRRFDSKAFKSTHGELYDQYCSETATRRFTVA